MRNAPCTFATLDEKLPGLRACLLQFFRETSGSMHAEFNDRDIRTHYIEIAGTRIKSDSGSSVVREHIQVFFNTIFWYLHAYYGKDMERNVMIIVAYREAVRTTMVTREATLNLQ